MMSLELFPNTQPRAFNVHPPHWGTGKVEESKVNLWAPKAPTWHYTGEPLKQQYTLTQLKQSNVRLNDQLLPRPQDCEMGKMMINLPFPAEHPYASHIERFSMFPTFDTPGDAKRGVAARGEMPKNSEMPSQPYDIRIVRKIKGNAYRHEIQALPTESAKKPLHWHEGDNFDQVVKSSDGKHVPYYPTPPRIFNPNLEERDDSILSNGNLQVSASTANATRNVEREQWQTTYNRAHTGLGPANTIAVDNLDEKEQKNKAFGPSKDEDDLHTHGVRTFHPPRPAEGRKVQALVAKPPPQTDHWPNPEKDHSYRRKLTEHETEENRLWTGQHYVNHPEGYQEAQNDKSKPFPNDPYQITTMHEPYVPSAAKPAKEATYMDGLRAEQREQHQQVEAQNRWKVLEEQTPDKNINARNQKMNMQVDKSQPNTFYRHEGQYNRERAALYKTSYDPHNIEQKATADGFYTMDSHKDALNSSFDINNQMSELMRKNRTLGNPGSVPQLHAQPSPHEVLGPYKNLRSSQKAQLQPSFESADVKTQENGTTLVETSYGEGYNTPKFLQENKIPVEVRKEPLLLMSTENKKLKKIRDASTPKRTVQFSADVTVASGSAGEPITLASAPINNPKLERAYSTLLPAQSHQVPLKLTRASTHIDMSHMSAAGPYQGNPLYSSLPVALEASRTAMANERLATGGSQECTRSWQQKGEYAELYPGTNHVDMSFKTDPRFDWTVGCGRPRPQSNLLHIQDSFTKSDAHRRFHEKFHENNPDLRENIITGKRHTFVGGINAQVLRGTPIVS